MKRSLLLMCAAIGLGFAGPAAAAYDGDWRGDITCVRGDDPFTSERHFRIVGRDMVSTRGDLSSEGDERLSGQIDESGEVMLHGTYMWGEKKTFWLIGRFEENRFVAYGRRGPKTCEMVLRPST